MRRLSILQILCLKIIAIYIFLILKGPHSSRTATVVVVDVVNARGSTMNCEMSPMAVLNTVHCGATSQIVFVYRSQLFLHRSRIEKVIIRYEAGKKA